MFFPISVAALLGGAIAFPEPESPRAIEQRQDRPEPVRTGNWTTLKCDTDGYDWGYNLDWTPAERWGRMDCKSAWDDVIAEWKTEWTPYNAPFSAVVMSRYGETISGECGGELWVSRNTCPATAGCTDQPGGVRPAGAEVANALARIHETFRSYHRGIPAIDNNIILPYQNFSQNLNRSDFLSHPTIRTSTLGVAVLAAAASSFNASLHDRPYFTHHPPSVLRASFTILAQALAHGINTTYPTVSGLYAFENAWQSAVETAALHLFRGSNESIDKLTALIADGRMTPGAADPERFLTSVERGALWDEAGVNLGKAFHMVVMQAMWEGAGAGVVVVPGRGEGCEDPMGKERRPEGVDEETAGAGWVCEGGRVYYLVGVRGGGKIGVPRGLEEVNREDNSVTGWGKHGWVKRGELVAGALRTFEANGGRNGGEPEFGEDGELVMQLYERGIGSPGLVRLPVCSAEEASANGKKKERWDVYPCNMVEGSVPVPAGGARGASGGMLGLIWAGLVMASLVLW